jgi:hypothetical protein
MAYYKVRIEVWCDWNPAESDVEEIAQGMGVGEAICTRREVVVVVDRPQDIGNEEAMSFFAGLGAMPTKVRGRSIYAKDPGWTRRILDFCLGSVTQAVAVRNCLIAISSFARNQSSSS